MGGHPPHIRKTLRQTTLEIVVRPFQQCDSPKPVGHHRQWTHRRANMFSFRHQGHLPGPAEPSATHKAVCNSRGCCRCHLCSRRAACIATRMANTMKRCAGGPRTPGRLGRRRGCRHRRRGGGCRPGARGPRVQRGRATERLDDPRRPAGRRGLGLRGAPRRRNKLKAHTNRARRGRGEAHTCVRVVGGLRRATPRAPLPHEPAAPPSIVLPATQKSYNPLQLCGEATQGPLCHPSRQPTHIACLTCGVKIHLPTHVARPTANRQSHRPPQRPKDSSTSVPA